MTIVAVGFLTVGTVVPGGILGGHDVTVDTCFWFVGKIKMGFPQVNRKKTQTCKNPCKDQDRKTPLWWWQQSSEHKVSVCGFRKAR
jgi:hypothetical protein